MKTRRGTDYSLPTDSSIDSNKICDDDDTSISVEIKQELETPPSSDFSPPNKPNGIKQSEIQVDTFSPIIVPTSPATHSPASTSLPAHTLLLGILSVTTPKKCE